MNLERRIKRLNNQFGQAFGFGPLGPKYQWVWLPNMSYWLWTDDTVVQLPQAMASLFVPSPKYKRLSWADRLGVRWALSVWKMPVSETEWTDRHGYSVPWPSKGEMQIIENVVLNAGPPAEEPNDDLTTDAIWAVRQDLAKSFEDFKAEGDKILADQQKDALNKIKDEIDDLPILYVPGTRGRDKPLIFTAKE